MSALRRLGARVVFAGVLSRPLWLAAAEDAHAAHHAPSAGDLLFPLINFAIFAALVAKYVVPAAREYLRRREQDIVAALEESRAALGAAEQALARTRSRQATIGNECAGMRRDLVSGASLQADRLRAQAEASGKHRLADAALVAEQERRRALQCVRVEVATLATTIAEARIRKALSIEDQRRFVRQFLEDAPTR